MARPGEGQGKASLRDVEPYLLEKRPITTKTFWRAGDVAMLTFEIIGLTMLALFFGAMVGGNRATR
jgi:hypothetical protein